MSAGVKSLEWVGSAKEDLRSFPDEVRSEIGYGHALYVAQLGEKHPDAKPFRGFGGAGVLEVVAAFDGDTDRAVYTVKFENAIYVLHVFQKKAKKGIATPPGGSGVDPKAAATGRTGAPRAKRNEHMSERTDDIAIRSSSGNVFADLGFADPEEMLLKAELARRISATIKARNLTQAQAAECLGVDQPKVSALMRGRLTIFSIDRLLRFLTALGNDVEIVVRENPQTESRGRLHMTAA
jgi:phage-related protein/predicted XRE-type DNA-binding protein